MKKNCFFGNLQEVRRHHRLWAAKLVALAGKSFLRMMFLFESNRIESNRENKEKMKQ